MVSRALVMASSLVRAIREPTKRFGLEKSLIPLITPNQSASVPDRPIRRARLQLLTVVTGLWLFIRSRELRPRPRNNRQRKATFPDPKKRKKLQQELRGCKGRSETPFSYRILREKGRSFKRSFPYLLGMGWEETHLPVLSSLRWRQLAFLLVGGTANEFFELRARKEGVNKELISYL